MPLTALQSPAGLPTVTSSGGAAGVRFPGSVRQPQARFRLGLCAENLHSDFERVTSFFSFSVCKVKVAQSCPSLCNPMGYTVHGILQARILEWGAFPFSRGSSQPRSPALQAILYQLSHTEAKSTCPSAGKWAAHGRAPTFTSSLSLPAFHSGRWVGLPPGLHVNHTQVQKE